MTSPKQIAGPGAAFLLLVLILFLLPSRPANAQTFQFLPEVDAYTKLHPDIRFNFQAKETREAGDPTQIEIGPGFDFFVKPLVRLRSVTAFDLDDSKARPLQFSVGFSIYPFPRQTPCRTPRVGRYASLADLCQHPSFRPQPCRSRLVQRPAQLALSQQSHDGTQICHQLAPPGALCCRRGLLPESVFEVDHHRPLCRLPAAPR
jgi:hypothetical protein